MKNIILILICLLFSFKINAQCNNPYYKMREGTLIVTESFNKKDKFQSRSEIKVIDFEDTNSGFIATMEYNLFDKKEKSISEGEYTITCENDVLKLDMSGFVPPESMEAFKDMEVELTMDQMEYPANLSPGQTLKDASIEIASSKGPVPMKLTFNITDRKVEGKESVTTPAGTFECMKISYNTHSKMMIANTQFTNVEYLSKDSGAVRTETYRSNGNLVSYTILTKYQY
jgi:hypothetical protein